MITYETKLENKGVTITSSTGQSINSHDAEVLLAWIVKQPDDIAVVYDGMAFYQPLFSLLPKNIVSLLVEGKPAIYKNFRLWFGITRHGRSIGITSREIERGNLYRRIEKEIYEIKPFVTLDNPTLEDVKTAGNNLMKTLSNMGFKTKRLTSAAAIYKENILDKMAIPTLLNMKEDADELQEMALNNINEWVSTYRSINEDNKYSYDLTAAYAAALAELPNLFWVDHYEKATEIPPGAFYGVLYGKIRNKTAVSPLINPETGRRQVEYYKGFMNTWEYGCVYAWDIAEMDIEYGWFMFLGKYHRLFDYSMRKLYDFRNKGNELQDNLAKAMAVSTYGKFLERRGEDYGDLFNPIYADMVTSSIRVKVADFIYSNKLQDDIVSVTVDGVKSVKYLDIPSTKRFGEWRKV